MFDDLRRRYRLRAAIAVLFAWPLSLLLTPFLFLAITILWALLVLPLAPIASAFGFGELSWPLILWPGAVIAVFLVTVGPFVMVLLADRVVPYLTEATQAGQEDERLLRRVDVLAPAAGVPPPRVLVVPSRALNAAALGLRKNRGVLLVTRRCSTLPEDELEAVVALAMANIAVGGLASGGLFLAVTAPLALTLVAYTAARRFARRREFEVAIAGMVLFALGGAFLARSYDRSLLQQGVAAFYVTCIAFASFYYWTRWALVAAAFVADRIIWVCSLVTRPARLAADSAAVGLTRLPPPFFRLLDLAAATRTFPHVGPWHIEPIWVLPTRGPRKRRELDRRRKLLGEIDPIAERGLSPRRPNR